MAIRHKRKNSSGYVWQSSDLVEGQVGLNIADGTMHFKKADNTVITVGSGAGATSLDGLTDVTITTPATDQVLKYDGTGWINATSPSGITDLVSDTTPQLGGDLDVNGWSITGPINQSIIINPGYMGGVPGVVEVLGQVWSDKFQIDTSATPAGSEGGLVWNDLDGTIEFQAKGGNVTVQIGQEQLVRIHNNTGSTLTDGQVVYITGSTGERPTVALASASSESTSSKTIGVVTETIANGAEGFVTTSGLVHGLNTNAYTEGDAVWLSTTAGAWTTTKPTSPNHGVFIGWIVKKSGGNGSIYVHIQNGYELDELHNVLISSVTNNQTLIWDSTASVWKNTALKTINGSSIIGSGNITIEGGTGGSSGFEQTFLMMGA